MSITGAKFLGSQFREQLAQVKATLANASTEMGSAMQELTEVAGQAVRTVKSVRDETAELKAALGLASNDAPQDTPLPKVELNAAGVHPEK